MSRTNSGNTQSTLIHPNIITFFELMVEVFDGHFYSVYKGSTTKTHAFQISMDVDRDEKIKIILPRGNGLFHPMDSRQIGQRGNPFTTIKAFSFLDTLSWLDNDMRGSSPRGTTWPFNDWEFGYKVNFPNRHSGTEDHIPNLDLAKRDLKKLLTGSVKKKPYFFLFKLYRDIFTLRYATETHQDIL